MQKINFIPPIVFEISDWAREFLHLTQEPHFSQTCVFNRIINVIMMHDLNPKNLQINRLIFFLILENPKKPYFWGVLGHFAQNEIVPQKSGSISFLPLRPPNFMGSFRKIVWAVLEKTSLPSDILTYLQWWNHRPLFN